ncbi:hypothetical protein AZ14_0158 [Bordetella bronchiseptica 980]|nr:hypothetical protein AZ14_0158 [Bordetella bronchiseptica 980]
MARPGSVAPLRTNAAAFPPSDCPQDAPGRAHPRWFDDLSC